MEEISISKFKATCLSLLERVRRTGQAILVTKRGEPIAQVLPPPPPERKEGWVGSFRHSGKIVGDVISPAAEVEQWEVLRK